MLKVNCSQEFTSLLLASKIVFRKVACVIEKERRTRVIRCYKCQHFGHLARFCNNKRWHEFCAGSHQSDKLGTHEVLCVNCSGVQLTLRDMKCLQNNIHSVNTSLTVLRYTVQRHQIDVALLLEIWHPADDCINIRNCVSSIFKLRQGSEKVVLSLSHIRMSRLFIFVNMRLMAWKLFGLMLC